MAKVLPKKLGTRRKPAWVVLTTGLLRGMSLALLDRPKR